MIRKENNFGYAKKLRISLLSLYRRKKRRMRMEITIQHRLREIENLHGIKILYSCESGSRAWGFPSPDSDYDVRFIYARRFDEYLSVYPAKDHLSFPINDDLDIYGWDIVKVLRLISKSNTTPFEWLQSPVLYRENEPFKNELWNLCRSYFCRRGNIYHYLGVARGAMGTMQDKEIKIKKLFYVIRPLLAALWCTDRKTIAPMNIYPLMDLLSGDLRKMVQSLIDTKATAPESYLVKVDHALAEWIDTTFGYCLDVVQHTGRKSFDRAKADHFFRKIIQR